MKLFPVLVMLTACAARPQGILVFSEQSEYNSRFLRSSCILLFTFNDTLFFNNVIKISSQSL